MTGVTKPSDDAPITFTVTGVSTDDILGHYQDHVIYKFVMIDGEKLYEYESIALQVRPNVYHVDKVDKNYIVLYGHLLYREVDSAPA